MKNAVLVVSTSILVYGLYLGVKYKSSGEPMPDNEKTISGIAMVIGLGGLGLGIFKLKSK